MTYEVIEEGPESAVVLVTESNDFFRLLKLDGQKLRVKFIVKGEQLKEEIVESILKMEPPYEEALQPAIEWAQAHRPQDLARAYPNGRMVFNDTTAKAWASLLKEWRRRVPAREALPTTRPESFSSGRERTDERRTCIATRARPVAANATGAPGRGQLLGRGIRSILPERRT
jgi:hypothetical protein